MPPLGDYLRARRAALDPDEAGIDAAGVRRVPGLRREEVAVRAALSADYYTRLEQGREARPSAAVLGALASALALDDDARAHLFALAGLLAPGPAPTAIPEVPALLLDLIGSWPGTPALVLGPGLDVLASNRAAEALFAPFAAQDNLARMVFVDAAAPAFYADWAHSAEQTVAALRAQSGGDGPRLTALVDELSAASPAFVALWARQDVRAKRSGDAKRLVHPAVGPLAVDYETLDVRSAPGLQLVAYRAAPGSASADALARLTSPAAVGA